MWSSHGMTPYMEFTLHWIDSEWKLHSQNLGMKFVPDNHTAKHLTITSDNGSNIKKACKDNEWRNVPCFGHNLHLAITSTLKNKPRVQRALGVSKKIVAAFGTSWKRRKDLAAVQVQEEPGQKFKNLTSVSMPNETKIEYF